MTLIPKLLPGIHILNVIITVVQTMIVLNGFYDTLTVSISLSFSFLPFVVKIHVFVVLAVYISSHSIFTHPGLRKRPLVFPSFRHLM